MAVTNMVATIPGKNLVNPNGGGFDCARTLQTAILVIPNGQLTDESIPIVRGCRLREPKTADPVGNKDITAIFGSCFRHR